MPVEAKICGLTDPAAVEAAARGGARFVGFNFYPPSPRHLKAMDAAALAALLPERVTAVAVMVDPKDAEIDSVVTAVRRIGIVQLQGSESPERVAEIARRTGLKVMRAIKVGGAEDVASARAYEGVVDYLMFDTRPVETAKDALPGGTGRSFDWSLVKDFTTKRPWMLAGGLNAGNVAEAVAISGARLVDVSSGVETAPGRKSPEKIAAFLKVVGAL
jgi:phosphoribosylanthranilate isomerase